MLFRKLICLLGLVALLAGCGDNPGTWPAEKVADYVKESLIREGLDITDVSLSPAGEGVFKGTAVAAEGEKLAIEVQQDAATRRLEWDAKGDRGSLLDGSFQLQ